MGTTLDFEVPLTDRDVIDVRIMTERENHRFRAKSKV